MKMILASKEKFLLEKAYWLLGIPKKDLKIGMITTALKMSQDQEYFKYIREYMESMQSSGIDFKEFDIDGKTEKEIRDFFADRNVAQVNGGNVFFLLKKVRESKFDVVLKELLEKGYIYIGCSAGAHLMTPTVETGTWKKGRERFGVENLTAFGYVPFLIKPHYSDNKREEVLKKIKTLKYPLRLLKDDQLFLVEDDKITFVGNSEEVSLG